MPRKARQNYVRLHVKNVTTMTAAEGFGERCLIIPLSAANWHIAITDADVAVLRKAFDAFMPAASSTPGSESE